jgi:hypothetical protein
LYAVEDATFQRARIIVSALARELSDQQAAGSRRPVDLHELVRRSADVDLPANGEADYLSSVAADLARLFPIEELFPRKRRARAG